MFSPKLVVVAVLVSACFLFASVAVASSTSATDFSDSGGILSGSNAGLSLSGSTLISVTGYPGLGSTVGDLGTVTFTTGALSSGTLQMGGTFAAGGTFTIDGNGTGGLANGVLFSGTFSGPATWTLTTLANGTHNYTLTGVITGTMGSKTLDGVTVQLTINTGKGLFDGMTTIAGGNTSLASVPEPSTLAMMGAGLLSLAGVLRRRALPRT
jgi:hypothetical protein